MEDSRAAAPPREVVLLGSTGSIGTQAADIVRRNPGRFRLTGLAAGGGNPELLARQALELGVEVVAVSSEAAAPAVQQALAAAAAADPAARPAGTGRAGRPVPKVLAGADAVAEMAAWPCDVVLNAVTGAAGLAATLAALDAGRVLALANKESLIMGGQLVAGRAAPGQIVPVDSEHSTIAQCLRGGHRRRGAPAGPDRQRRAVPAPRPRGAGAGDSRAGAGPPDLEHGPGHHHQLAPPW